MIKLNFKMCEETIYIQKHIEGAREREEKKETV